LDFRLNDFIKVSKNITLFFKNQFRQELWFRNASTTSRVDACAWCHLFFSCLYWLRKKLLPYPQGCPMASVRDTIYICVCGSPSQLESLRSARKNGFSYLNKCRKSLKCSNHVRSGVQGLRWRFLLRMTCWDSALWRGAMRA
jgi:hypothetical protein